MNIATSGGEKELKVALLMNLDSTMTMNRLGVLGAKALPIANLFIWKKKKTNKPPSHIFFKNSIHKI